MSGEVPCLTCAENRNPSWESWEGEMWLIVWVRNLLSSQGLKRNLKGQLRDRLLNCQLKANWIDLGKAPHSTKLFLKRIRKPADVEKTLCKMTREGWVKESTHLLLATLVDRKTGTGSGKRCGGWAVYDSGLWTEEGSLDCDTWQEEGQVLSSMLNESDLTGTCLFWGSAAEWVTSSKFVRWMLNLQSLRMWLYVTTGLLRGSLRWGHTGVEWALIQ